MGEYICPKCGKRTMIKKIINDKRYILVCEVCKAKRGPLPGKKK